MIFSLRVRSCANCVGFYMIPYIWAHIFGVGSANTRKCHRPMQERISSCTRSLCMWWPLDGKYLYFLSVWLNIIALIPIRQYFSMIQFLAVGWNIESVNLPDEVVNLWIFTIGLTSSGCQPHTSSVWPWSGMPKVRVYGTFMSGLRHYFLCWYQHACRPEFSDFLTRRQCVADMLPTFLAKAARMPIALIKFSPGGMLM
jgi:hypothetical protein